MVPSRSARWTSTAQTATTADNAATAMERCSRGVRPANSVTAAARVGIRTGSGVRIAAVLMRDPASLLAGCSSGTLVPGQRVQFVGRVGVAVRVVGDEVFVDGDGRLVRQLG